MLELLVSLTGGVIGSFGGVYVAYRWFSPVQPKDEQKFEQTHTLTAMQALNQKAAMEYLAKPKSRTVKPMQSVSDLRNELENPPEDKDR